MKHLASPRFARLKIFQQRACAHYHSSLVCFRAIDDTSYTGGQIEKRKGGNIRMKFMMMHMRMLNSRSYRPADVEENGVC